MLYSCKRGIALVNRVDKSLYYLKNIFYIIEGNIRGRIVVRGSGTDKSIEGRLKGVVSLNISILSIYIISLK